MIKGVNKRIIEINNPESIYFERAVFYLKPNVRELPSAIAKSEAERYISRLGMEASVSRKRPKTGKIFLLLVALAAVAGIVSAFFL